MDTGSSTQAARGTIDEVAARHGLGRETVEAMLRAVIAGGGTMAQFDIPALGGYGQWMRGGMTMVGNMFDNELRGRVDRLAAELATLYFDPPFTLQRELANPEGGRAGTDTGAPQASLSGGQSQWQGSGSRQSQSQGGGFGTMSASGFGGGSFGGNWWPDGLGHPSTSGGQNDSRYAYFPQTNRLAIQRGGGAVELYDTTGYDISGVSQQQGGFGASTFSSAQGPVPLDRLPRLGGAGPDRTEAKSEPREAARSEVPPRPAGTADMSSQDTSSAASVREATPATPGGQTAPRGGHADVLDALERLGTLKEKGILTEAEFSDKKRELLARL